MFMEQKTYNLFQFYSQIFIILLAGLLDINFLIRATINVINGMHTRLKKALNWKRNRKRVFPACTQYIIFCTAIGRLVNSRDIHGTWPSATKLTFLSLF